MKKEVVLAIILGLTAGVIVTFGVYTANRALQQRAAESSTEATPLPPSAEEEPSAPQPAQKSALEIETPESNSIATEEILTTRGQTFPSALIVVMVNDTDFLGTANESGKFTIPVKLTPGSNTLVFTAQDPNSTAQEEAQRLVVFSTADLNRTSTATGSSLLKSSPTPKPTASPSPAPRR